MLILFIALRRMYIAFLNALDFFGWLFFPWIIEFTFFSDIGLLNT